MIMAPSKSTDDEDDKAVIQTIKTQNYIDRKLYKTNQTVNQKIESMELNSLYSISNQQENMSIMMARLREVSDSV